MAIIKNLGALNAQRAEMAGEAVECARDDSIGAIAFKRSRAGGGCVIYAFSGRRLRADLRYFYRSDDAALNSVKVWLDELQRAEARRLNEKMKLQKKRADGRGLQVGSVLVSSWGYDQTNIDFYEVVALVGKASVRLRPIAQEVVEQELAMTGQCVPCVGQYTGEAFTKRIGNDGTSVKISSYEWARLKGKTQVTAGVTIYTPEHFTTYA